jgi:hypothetical protein
LKVYSFQTKRNQSIKFYRAHPIVVKDFPALGSLFFAGKQIVPELISPKTRGSNVLIIAISLSKF